MQDVLEGLYAVVQQRKIEPQEGSYTCYLLDKGLDKILKKCGEECSEVIIAAKNGQQQETIRLTHVLRFVFLIYHDWLVRYDRI